MKLFKNKFDNVKREDIVDAICTLESQQKEKLKEIEDRQKEINKLFNAGKRETSKEIQVIYAKKINYLQHENKITHNRISYLHANISTLMQLKEALDDKEFMQNNAGLALNKLLTKQDSLKKYLTGITEERMKLDENLEMTSELFNSVQEGYLESEKIYGVDDNTNKILAIFETEKQNDDEMNSDEDTHKQLVLDDDDDIKF